MSLNQHLLWTRRPPSPSPSLASWGDLGAPERALPRLRLLSVLLFPLPIGSPNTDNSQAPSLDRDVPSLVAEKCLVPSPFLGRFWGLLPSPFLGRFWGVCFPVTRRVSPWIPCGRAAKVSQCRGQAGRRMDCPEPCPPWCGGSALPGWAGPAPASSHGGPRYLSGRGSVEGTCPGQR